MQDNHEINLQLPHLEALFTQYEIPMGLLNPLLDYRTYHLDFVIDDSVAMLELSDIKRKDAMSEHMQAQLSVDHVITRPEDKLTRWEEVQDRLHVLIALFAYIPMQSFNVHFMNRRYETPEFIAFSHKTLTTRHPKTPQAFAQEAHTQVSLAFARAPHGTSAPLRNLMNKLISKSHENERHAITVLTASLPDDAHAQQLNDDRSNPFVSLLTLKRQTKEQHCPVSFISCTDKKEHMQWMKNAVKAATFCSQSDNYSQQAQTILEAQGIDFHFTRGMSMLLPLLNAATKPLSQHLDQEPADEDEILNPDNNLTIKRKRDTIDNGDDQRYHAHPSEGPTFFARIKKLFKGESSSSSLIQAAPRP